MLCMHASPHVCLVSRSLLGWGGQQRFIMFYCLCPWSTVLVVSCGVVVGGAITSYCLYPWSNVRVVSWGVVGGATQRLTVSCTLAYVTSYHLTPSVTSYIFKWLFPIPWFVACWFPFIPVVVSLSKGKMYSVFVCCRCDAQSDELRTYIFSLPTLYIWAGFGWRGWATNNI